MRPAIADLVKRAQAVASLWNLTLMAGGAAPARGRAADVLHQAIENLKLAAAAVEAEERAKPCE